MDVFFYDELLESYKGVWNKFSNSIKNLIVNLSTISENLNNALP